MRQTRRRLPPQPRKLSQRVIYRRLANTFNEIMSEALGMREDEARAIIEALVHPMKPAEIKKLSPSEFGNNIKAVVRVAIGNLGKAGLKQAAMGINSEADLEKMVEEMRRDSYQLPTEMRRAIMSLVSTFPRRGGRGRTPKLTPRDEHRACDQIAAFVRQGSGVKDALKRTAEMSVPLFGKPVSVRTLQKAWKKRGTFSTA